MPSPRTDIELNLECIIIRNMLVWCMNEVYICVESKFMATFKNERVRWINVESIFIDLMSND